MRINIHRKIASRFFRRLNQIRNDIIIVRSLAVFCTDRYLMLFAGKTVSYTSHIHGKHFCHTIRNGSGSAVSNLFKNCHVEINSPLRSHAILFDMLCVSKKHCGTELIIQETALDIAALCNCCSRFKADKISGHNSQLLRLLFGRCLFVNNNLHHIVCPLCLRVFTIYVNRGVAKLACPVIDTSVPCPDADSLTFCGVGVDSSHRRNLQTSVALDL